MRKNPGRKERRDKQEHWDTTPLRATASIIKRGRLLDHAKVAEVRKQREVKNGNNTMSAK